MHILVRYGRSFVLQASVLSFSTIFLLVQVVIALGASCFLARWVGIYRLRSVRAAYWGLTVLAYIFIFYRRVIVAADYGRFDALIMFFLNLAYVWSFALLAMMIGFVFITLLRLPFTLKKLFTARKKQSLPADASVDDLLATLYEGRPELFQSGVEGGTARERFAAAPEAVVTGTEIFGGTKPSAKLAERRNAVISWLQSKGWFKTFTNTETGWGIDVSTGSIRNTSAHGLGEKKAQVLAALPELLENAVYLEKGRTTEAGHKRHIFAAKARVGAESFVVGIVIDEDYNGKRFYNHELTTIKDLDGTKQVLPPESGNEPGSNQGLSVLNIVRKHLNVKPDNTST